MSERTMTARADGPAIRLGVPAALVATAAIGWWWSARMASEMSPSMPAMDAMPGMSQAGAVMSLGAFVVAWLAMMIAMMFPAIMPVVKLYSRAAAAGRVAPLPFFVAGYIVVWTSLGLPAYVAWRALMDPIAEVQPWAGRLAGGVLLAAAIWQLTPLKSLCLRHCRSPISFFMRFGGSLERPFGAFRMGATHGAYCVACCWALMAILVAFGTMNLLWMVALSVLILLEKNAPRGEWIARVAAAAFGVLGVLLLVDPAKLAGLT